MEEILAGLYNRLANHIVSMIPEEWESVYYLGEIEKGKSSWSSTFYFRDPQREEYIKSSSIPKVYQVPKNVYMTQWLQLNNIMLEIYNCFNTNGQPLWEQICFAFDQAGKFQVDFHYDVMHADDGGQLIRELMWAQSAFGYEPTESEKKILDRHFAEG